MEYLVKDSDGELVGPLDQETMLKWVELDRIFPDTPVRSTMVAKWKEAGDLEFLSASFEKQKPRLEAKVESEKGFLDRTFELLGSKSSKRHEKKKHIVEDKRTSFKYEYLPNPASASKRILSALFDWLIIGFAALFLFFLGAGIVCSGARSGTAAAPPYENKEEAKKPNPDDAPPQEMGMSMEFAPGAKNDMMSGCRLGTIWTDSSTGKVYACLRGSIGNALWCERSSMNSVFQKLFVLLSAFTLMYFGLSLGIFAQTPGMWYWGIFIARPDLSEVFMFRAYVFGALSIFLGFLVPALSSVMPKGRTVHDLLCDVWVISIAAKPKA